MFCGVVNLRKPRGISSREAVDLVKRQVRPAKVGHAGTLDPLAEGVLVVCVGPATRLIEYVQRMPKRYTGTFLLGRTSPTEDVEGEVTLLDNPPRPALADIVEAARRLTGEILQRPPAFSALKVDGRRAYELARAGRDVELEPRPVVVHRLDVVHYEYPDLTLDIECGSGTYVRSLGRDLASSLGTAAVMSALVRTAVGDFLLDDSCTPERLEQEPPWAWLLPTLRALGGLPQITLPDADVARVERGQFIAPPVEASADELAALTADGRLVGVLRRRADGQLGPVVNLPRPD